MSSSSRRLQQQKTTCLNDATALLLLSDSFHGYSGYPRDSDHLENEADEFEELAYAMLSVYGAPHLPRRRGPYGIRPRSTDYFSTLLALPDREFRSQFRLSHQTFRCLIHLLRDNPIFWSTSLKPQHPVEHQLAAFLLRYGSLACDTMTVALQLSLGHGTVLLYCRRVAKALRQLRSRFVLWGAPENKAEIKSVILQKSGLDNCLGSCDGTLICFNRRPNLQSEEGIAYISRKGLPSTNVQATVDHRLRFTSYELGWPGSAPDIKVFKQSDLWRNRHQYFEPEEYILVDKGYMTSPNTLRPFDEREIATGVGLDAHQMRSFNRRLCSVRIWSEHAFGRLKGRFRSLRLFPVHKTMKETYEAIEAMLILHNICIECGDCPEVLHDYNEFRGNFWDNSDEDDSEGLGFDPEIIQAVCTQLGGPINIPDWETDVYLRNKGKEL